MWYENNLISVGLPDEVGRVKILHIQMSTNGRVVPKTDVERLTPKMQMSDEPLDRYVFNGVLHVNHYLED